MNKQNTPNRIPPQNKHESNIISSFNHQSNHRKQKLNESTQENKLSRQNNCDDKENTSFGDLSIDYLHGEKFLSSIRLSVDSGLSSNCSSNNKSNTHSGNKDELQKSKYKCRIEQKIVEVTKANQDLNDILLKRLAEIENFKVERVQLKKDLQEYYEKLAIIQQDCTYYKGAKEEFLKEAREIFEKKEDILKRENQRKIKDLKDEIIFFTNQKKKDELETERISTELKDLKRQLTDKNKEISEYKQQFTFIREEREQFEFQIDCMRQNEVNGTRIILKESENDLISMTLLCREKEKQVMQMREQISLLSDQNIKSQKQYEQEKMSKEIINLQFNKINQEYQQLSQKQAKQEQFLEDYQQQILIPKDDINIKENRLSFVGDKCSEQVDKQQKQLQTLYSIILEENKQIKQDYYHLDSQYKILLTSIATKPHSLIQKSKCDCDKQIVPSTATNSQASQTDSKIQNQSVQSLFTNENQQLNHQLSKLQESLSKITQEVLGKDKIIRDKEIVIQQCKNQIKMLTEEKMMIETQLSHHINQIATQQLSKQQFHRMQAYEISQQNLSNSPFRQPYLNPNHVLLSPNLVRYPGPNRGLNRSFDNIREREQSFVCYSPIHK